MKRVENALIQMLTGLHARTRDWGTRPDERAPEENRNAEPGLDLADQGPGALLALINDVSALSRMHRGRRSSDRASSF